MKAASWADARKSDTVSLFDLQHLSPKAIYALASGKYDHEVVELVLSAAATRARWHAGRIGAEDDHAGQRSRSRHHDDRRGSGSRSRSVYRSAGTPIGKSIDYLDLATIKLPAPAHRCTERGGSKPIVSAKVAAI